MGARAAVVILAAGASTRMGEPKQLAMVGGERLLDRAVRVAGEASLAPTVVVLGGQAKLILESCRLQTAWVVVNAGWAEGMGSSVRAGVELAQGFPEIDGAVVMTCDMPTLRAEHLRGLCERPEEVTASGYGERRGVPAYFPRWAFPELLRLRGDAGARELLREARTVVLEGGELDVDTPEDLRRARADDGG